MEGLGSETPFARLAAEALGDRYFTLVDVGCSSGIDEIWRLFGNHLRAFGFNPNFAEVTRLATQETLEGVKYFPDVVAVPDDDPGAPQMRAREFWARNPWARLSVARTMKIRDSATRRADSEEPTKLKLWPQVRLADERKPVVLPAFFRERQVDDVDFIKIQVNGADFLILRSLEAFLEEAKVVGIGINVNFFGSEDPEVHTFHNVDRFMKHCGFELFSLTTRPYSMAALPAPYQLDLPAQGAWGRPLLGDAIYFRDVAAPDQGRRGQSLGAHKLIKLAALFSLARLPDCAAEVLQRFRFSISQVLDVDAGLDALTAQCIPSGQPVPSYDEYIAEFEGDSERFYPARPKADSPPST